MKKWYIWLSSFCLVGALVFICSLFNVDYNNRVMDDANVYSYEEEEQISNYINLFIKLSGIDLKCSTVDSKIDYDKLYYKIQSDDSFGKGIHKNGILITFIKENNETHIATYGDSFWDTMGLRSFWIKCLNNTYIGNEDTAKHVISNILAFYIERNLKIFSVLLFSASVITWFILKKIKNNYKILEKADAKNYYLTSDIEIM